MKVASVFNFSTIMMSKLRAKQDLTSKFNECSQGRVHESYNESHNGVETMLKLSKSSQHESKHQFRH